jgi:hypothetical protein
MTWQQQAQMTTRQQQASWQLACIMGSWSLQTAAG